MGKGFYSSPALLVPGSSPFARDVADHDTVLKNNCYPSVPARDEGGGGEGV